MDVLLDFFSFQDPNVRWVSIGCILLGIGASINGTFIFLRKQSLIGDAVAHAILPGICIAFLFSGTKNPLILSLGALVTGWFSIFCINWISKNTKIKEDGAIAIVLSVFFAVGIMLLTHIQQTGMGNQSGLDTFLFGKAAAMDKFDVIVFACISLLIISVVLLLKKEFSLIAFDPSFSRSIGKPRNFLDNALNTLTILSIVTGIQAVGVVLMAALLITPPAAARFWTNKLNTMLLLSAMLGSIAGISGAFVSYAAPNMPTGPWIVMVISLIAIFSFIFAPKKGVFFKFYRQVLHKNRILRENILKFIYKELEKIDFQKTFLSQESILNSKIASGRSIRNALRRLRWEGFLTQGHEGLTLSPEGVIKARRIVKLHRLWELYLTDYLNIAPDHVHDDAESMEHIITPEIERKLEEKLQFPQTDPHQRNIPYE